MLYGLQQTRPIAESRFAMPDVARRAAKPKARDAARSAFSTGRIFSTTT